MLSVSAVLAEEFERNDQFDHDDDLLCGVNESSSSSFFRCLENKNNVRNYNTLHLVQISYLVYTYNIFYTVNTNISTCLSVQYIKADFCGQVREFRRKSLFII